MKFELLEKNNLDDYIKNIYSTNKGFAYKYISNNIEDTIKLSTSFAKYIKTGDVLNLNGELGSGKTVFVTGLAKYFNIESEVSSPTFTIVNEYNIENNKMFHFDVYRIENSDEFLDSIGTEYFHNGICIIEWGNIIEDILPINTVNIEITKDYSDESIRFFKIWRN